MHKKPLRIIAGATVFAIAMGFLEAVVVIYLREIYYPGGFRFPLQAIAAHIARFEMLRELSTIVMLVSFGILVGRNPNERLACFMYCFGVWDIFYYVFLKILIGWPDSLLTWDILFLIPTIWTGPVIAPCINSLTMIAFAVVVICSVDKDRRPDFGRLVWSLFGAGALFILVCYLQGFVLYMAHSIGYPRLVQKLGSSEAMAITAAYVPSRFNWALFSVGVALHWTAVVVYCRKVFVRA